MKLYRSIILYSYLVCYLNLAKSQSVMFQRTYGFSGNDISHCMPNLDSGYTFYGANNFNTPNESLILSKTDRYGDIIWQKNIYIPSAPIISTQNFAQTLSDSGYVLIAIAPTFNMACAIRTDKNGNIIWIKPSEVSGKIKNTLDGGYVLTQSNVVEKRDAQFNVQWAYQYNTTSDFFQNITATLDSGYIVYGDTKTYSMGGPTDSDVYLLKLDKNGNVLWSKTYGTLNGESARDVKQTQDGGYIVCASFIGFNNSPEILLIKTDAAGNIQWQKIYGGPSVDAPVFVDVANGFHAGYIIGGNSHGLENDYYPGKKSYLIKVDYFGNVIWAKMYGEMTTTSLWDDVLEYFYKTNDNGYLLSGKTHGLTNNHADWDVWLVKTDSMGVSGCNELSVTPASTSPSLTVSFGFNIQTLPLVTGTTPFTSNSITCNPVILCTNHIITSNNETFNLTNEFLIYPNPSKGIFVIDPDSHLGNVKKITIHDMLGRHVFTQQLSTDKITVDLTAQPNGIYFLQCVLNNGEVVYQKIVKQ